MRNRRSTRVSSVLVSALALLVSGLLDDHPDHWSLRFQVQFLLPKF